ncbi:MAG: 30S ribosomal protein S3 [Candidatus Methanoperedens sp.]
MGVERKFVRMGLERAQIAEFFAKQLDRAGYGGMNINRTPMGTQVTIFAEKPGMIIGKGGKTIHKLTRDLEHKFKIDNPQIDVQEVKVPELNAKMMASRLAGAIERGLYFRKAGHNMLRRIMESGALGCEIDIAGKLTGPRNRTEKFVAGNMLHAGNPAIELVDNGFAIAIKKLGVIGCRVRIVPPVSNLPGRFSLVKPAVSEEAAAVKQPEGIEEIVTSGQVETGPEKVTAEAVKPEAGTNVEAAAEVVRAMEPVVQAEAEEEKPEIETPAEAAHEPEVEERMQGDVLEHKHPEFNYWHPASRVHKTEDES